MKIIKIGIAPQEKIRERALAIVRGRYNPFLPIRRFGSPLLIHCLGLSEMKIAFYGMLFAPLCPLALEMYSLGRHE